MDLFYLAPELLGQSKRWVQGAQDILSPRREVMTDIAHSNNLLGADRKELEECTMGTI